MIDENRLVRRGPTRPLVWLGEPKERAVERSVGARFPAYPVKEKDFALEPQRPPRS